MASDNTTTYVVAGILALLLLGGAGTAKADEPGPPKPDDLPPDIDPDNWGSTPADLIPEFQRAEIASGIPGLGRFLAVWSWGAFRAMQPFVSPQEAAVIAASNPQLCRTCRNDSPSEKIASRRALENVVLPKGQKGQYGEGKYSPAWPMPANFDAWADFGSAGLFDILAGSHAHSGIHDPGKFSPLIAFSPEVLYRVDVQLFVGGYIVQRILKSPLYKVLVPGDPAKTWTNIRRVTASPQGFVQDTQYSKEVGERFVGRAYELGIDLDQLAYPWPISWPGASTYYSKLAVGQE